MANGITRSAPIGDGPGLWLEIFTLAILGRRFRLRMPAGISPDDAADDCSQRPAEKDAEGDPGLLRDAFPGDGTDQEAECKPCDDPDCDSRQYPFDRRTGPPPDLRLPGDDREEGERSGPQANRALEVAVSRDGFCEGEKAKAFGSDDQS